MVGSVVGSKLGSFVGFEVGDLDGVGVGAYDLVGNKVVVRDGRLDDGVIDGARVGSSVGSTAGSSEGETLVGIRLIGRIEGKVDSFTEGLDEIPSCNSFELADIEAVGIIVDIEADDGKTDGENIIEAVGEVGLCEVTA